MGERYVYRPGAPPAFIAQSLISTSSGERPGLFVRSIKPASKTVHRSKIRRGCGLSDLGATPAARLKLDAPAVPLDVTFMCRSLSQGRDNHRLSNPCRGLVQGGYIEGFIKPLKPASIDLQDTTVRDNCAGTFGPSAAASYLKRTAINFRTTSRCDHGWRLCRQRLLGVMHFDC